MENWPLLGRLKRAVNKLRFLMKFDLHRWVFASSGAAGRRSSSKRLLENSSFGDHLPGLRACVPMDEDRNESEDQQSPGPSPIGSRSLQRTTSYPSEEDIDKKAEMFIANFYRQLQLERQVSLQLRYRQENCFDSRSP